MEVFVFDKVRGLHNSYNKINFEYNIPITFDDKINEQWFGPVKISRVLENTMVSFYITLKNENTTINSYYNLYYDSIIYKNVPIGSDNLILQVKPFPFEYIFLNGIKMIKIRKFPIIIGLSQLLKHIDDKFEKINELNKNLNPVAYATQPHLNEDLINPNPFYHIEIDNENNDLCKYKFTYRVI